MADESDLRPLLSAKSAGSNLVTDFAADKISILRDGGAMCASGAIGVLAHSDEPSSTQFRKRTRDARRNAEMFIPLQATSTNCFRRSLAVLMTNSHLPA
jgi:hypothetical protein